MFSSIWMFTALFALWVCIANAKRHTTVSIFPSHTRVLYPPIDTGVSLSTMTAGVIGYAGLVGDIAGKVTLAGICTQLSGASACQKAPAVTYAVGPSTLVYHGQGTNITCNIQFTSSVATQTCAIVKAVYAGNVTAIPTTSASAVSSTTTVSIWTGSQGYVNAVITGKLSGSAGRLRYHHSLGGTTVLIAAVVGAIGL